MSTEALECYVIPAKPVSLLLPKECVAEIVKGAKVEPLRDARATWMKGHLTWNNQRLPVMSYSALIDSSAKEKGKGARNVAVLHPIPDAARKAYSGVSFSGAAKLLTVDQKATFVDLPEGVDKRYVDATVEVDGKSYLIPKLVAIGVAFSYF